MCRVPNWEEALHCDQEVSKYDKLCKFRTDLIKLGVNSAHPKQKHCGAIIQMDTQSRIRSIFKVLFFLDRLLESNMQEANQ